MFVPANRPTLQISPPPFSRPKFCRRTLTPDIRPPIIPREQPRESCRNLLQIELSCLALHDEADIEVLTHL